MINKNNISGKIQSYSLAKHIENGNVKKFTESGIHYDLHDKKGFSITNKNGNIIYEKINQDDIEDVFMSRMKHDIEDYSLLKRLKDDFVKKTIKKKNIASESKSKNKSKTKSKSKSKKSKTKSKSKKSKKAKKSKNTKRNEKSTNKKRKSKTSKKKTKNTKK